MGTKSFLFFNLLFCAFFIQSNALAADPTPPPPVGKIDLKKVKQDQGPQVQVVQNRTFSKEGRFKLSLIGGAVLTDPFVSDYAVGGKLGYNFSNFFALQVLAWKDISKELSLNSFQNRTGNSTNPNLAKSLYALEGLWTPIYGKLNLLNESIIYYDFHAGLGLGMRGTESGSNIAYIVNVGQDFFISKHITFEFEYRALMFNQRILEKVLAASIGQELGKQFEFSHVFTLGLGFLF